MNSLSVCLVLLAGSLTCAHAQETAPILRLEAGMHTARIEDIAGDAAGQLVITASHDKTARVWSQAEGRLLHVLRPPIGNANEGKLNAVALSPDGKIAALAGLTGYEWDRTVSVYLFDVSSGQITSRLAGLPDIVFRLAFSASGRYLAAGLGGGAGVRIWDCQTGRLTAELAGFSNNCHGLDWHGDDLLATSCLDGKVKTFRVRNGVPDAGLSRDFGGLRPFGVSISPDGGRLAVGFLDRPEVKALTVPSLESAFTPDLIGIDNGNLKAVCWSHDGSRLYAAGHWDVRGSNPVRAWDDLGRKVSADVVIPSNFLHSMDAQGTNGVAVSGGGPVWATIQAGRVTRRLDPPLAQWEHTFSAFRCSPDGTKVSFSWTEDAKAIGLFDLSARTLLPAANTAGLQGLAVASHGAMGVRSWCSAGNETERRRALDQGLRESDLGAPDGSTAPAWRGLAINLTAHDISRCVAAAPDGSALTLGSDFRLARYRSDGLIWSVQPPGITWVVNETTDGRLVIAGHHDGTIRWYRANDGQELLALFAHADRKRWVLWTPLGYFDCSPGAEDLIGWHVNRDKNQASDYFPVARFRLIYYRPDVLQKVLKTLDVPAAVREANAALGRPDEPVSRIADIIDALSPPVVDLTVGGPLREAELTSPDVPLRLRYRVRNTGRQAATRVEVRANGRPLPILAPTPQEGREDIIPITLPAWFDGEVSVIASHSLASSEAATLRVRPKSPRPPAPKPKLFVISLGVAELAMNENAASAPVGVTAAAKDRFANLEFAADDARKVAARLEAEQGKAFSEVETLVLLNQQATCTAIRQAISHVQSRAKMGDVLFFFFSGHGNHDPKDGKFHLVTHETDPHRESATALSGEELGRLLGQMQASIVLALDACHSGAVLGMQLGNKYKVPPLDISGLANQLSSSEYGIVVLSSSTPDQVSFEDRELGGGLFTKALLDGLDGKAAKDGVITCSRLMAWIDQSVPKLAASGDDTSGSTPVTTQTPITVMPKGVPDFVLAAP